MKFYKPGSKERLNALNNLIYTLRELDIWNPSPYEQIVHYNAYLYKRVYIRENACE